MSAFLQQSYKNALWCEDILAYQIYSGKNLGRHKKVKARGS